MCVNISIVDKVLAILYAPVNRNIRCETLGFQNHTQSFLAYGINNTRKPKEPHKQIHETKIHKTQLSALRVNEAPFTVSRCIFIPKKKLLLHRTVYKW